MILNKEENRLDISEGYSEYIVDTDKNICIDISCSVRAEVFMRIKNAKSIKINNVCFDNSNLTLLIWNESKGDVTFEERHEVKANATLNLAYGDLNSFDTTRNSFVDLVSQGASALVKSASLCKSKKDNKLEIKSSSPYTSGNMENFSVVLSGGNYKMYAVGSIGKNAYQSESHQSSRALCFNETNLNAMITPVLLIDENDVKASHATSVGRLDENQMIYMKSRGLTESEVLALVSSGYLLPIADFIDNEELRNNLREIIESQVARECLI